MSQQEFKKQKLYNLGRVYRAPKPDKSGNPRHYFKLEQSKDKDGNISGDSLFPITLANGVQLNEGDSLPMFSVPVKFEKLVNEGRMTQAKADELDFIRFEVCASIDEDKAPAPQQPSDKKGKVDF